ncbi:hypothetical protein [Streptomyces sp. NPDC059874]|uniref:hypothetical protein n=1 Tax=Streptomyces sp. NPDC059874 TaxID=3346983 RepID=UPI0036631366
MLELIVRHHIALTLTSTACAGLLFGLAEFLGDLPPLLWIAWAWGAAAAGIQVCAARMLGRRGAPAGTAGHTGGAS